MCPLPSTDVATLDGLHLVQAPTLIFAPTPESARSGTLPSGRRFGLAGNDSESCPPSRPGALQEQLDKVEREIELYEQFDRSEKARFNRECFLWTAEDRIEWQETRIGNAERLQELLKERSDLREKLRAQGL